MLQGAEVDIEQNMNLLKALKDYLVSCFSDKEVIGVLTYAKEMVDEQAIQASLLQENQLK